MSATLTRITVLLKAAPLYLTIAGVVVAIVVQQVSAALPPGWQDNAAQIGGIIASILAAATAIVRRVTPVLESDRGLLPPDRPVAP